MHFTISLRQKSQNPSHCVFMASSSSGSLDTLSANNFTFSAHPFMPTSSSSSSFTDLLQQELNTNTNTTRGLSDRVAERTGSGVPKFKSIQPPSLPISPPSLFSPTSYFSIPPGLSPAELLDSPVLLNVSNLLPSPTTGSFPPQAFNWRNNTSNFSQQQKSSVKQEEKNFSDFSFHTQKGLNTTSSTLFQTQQQQQPRSYQNSIKQDSMKSFSPEISTLQTTNNSHSNNGFLSDYGNYNQQTQTRTNTIRESRKSDDGYNWRKYGQKQVKGSENPRSYYKCTFPNCPTKKKVERSLDGQITEIVYKGSHNHPKPQSTRRSSSSSVSSNVIQGSSQNTTTGEVRDQSFATSTHGSGQMDSVATPENSSISVGDDDFDRASQRSKSGGGDDYDEDEPEAKRWKIEGENEGISAPGNRTVREPRVVVQTTSDIDILDDGYRWRKYGQKVVKGNPNPRSYYKCTHPACPVRKHVERASHDLRAVITTYEGKHNHDVPAARGSGSRSLSLPNNNNNNASLAIRAPAMSNHSNNPMVNPLRNVRLPSSDGQAPFSLEMLQSPGGYGFSGLLASPLGSYMNEGNPTTKEEPRDDLFFESLLY
ncbi:hypothetical protein Ddye_012749 [Dipteronia dyeriana]|uniref:WRKY domain-containing protein n=1 Tax=Dipteronia dyeriana TaxID=168575 RepID=A0AAD9X4V7_9ROSI|nr:hypothetical protein Ddye_012749 [Dipteronia dyeriana]